MAMPLRQTIKVATYLAEQKLRRREKFPLIVELEPLFACNLACEGAERSSTPPESSSSACRWPRPSALFWSRARRWCPSRAVSP